MDYWRATLSRRKLHALAQGLARGEEVRVEEGIADWWNRRVQARTGARAGEGASRAPGRRRTTPHTGTLGLRGGSAMKRITIPIALQVQGPILTKSSSMGALGLDAVMAQRDIREPGDRRRRARYYLPGRLVKGLLLEAWQELSTVDGSSGEPITKWLGDESVKDSDDKPDRENVSCLRISRTGKRFPMASRRRASGSRSTKSRGAADAGKMQVTESPYASGQVVRFRGAGALPCRRPKGGRRPRFCAARWNGVCFGSRRWAARNVRLRRPS